MNIYSDPELCSYGALRDPELCSYGALRDQSQRGVKLLHVVVVSFFCNRKDITIKKGTKIDEC